MRTGCSEQVLQYCSHHFTWSNFGKKENFLIFCLPRKSWEDYYFEKETISYIYKEEMPHESTKSKCPMCNGNSSSSQKTGRNLQSRNNFDTRRLV